jgi:hypothetical protein
MGNGDLEEKKLLGSGGYAIAKLTEQEELRANQKQNYGCKISITSSI